MWGELPVQSAIQENLLSSMRNPAGGWLLFRFTSCECHISGATFWCSPASFSNAPVHPVQHIGDFFLAAASITSDFPSTALQLVRPWINTSCTPNEHAP